MKYGIALALALTLNAVANLMMKFGVKRFEGLELNLSKGLTPAISAITTNWVLLLGLLCFAVNVIFYTYALSGIKVSIAYPIMIGGGFAIIAVVAGKYLNETLSPPQWIGVALIIIGVMLVARGMNSTAGG